MWRHDSFRGVKTAGVELIAGTSVESPRTSGVLGVGEPNVGEASKQLSEDDLDLDAGKVGRETQMGPEAER